jgi:hypothetical protein
VAFDPIYPEYAGMLPILASAQEIIERDMGDALIWRFGVNPVGDNYARIQNTQMHSSDYPLLIIQPATDDRDPLGVGGIVDRQVFDVEISLTRSIDSGDPIDGVNTLTRDLIRYYDATVMCFESAPGADWVSNFPGSEAQSKVQVSCTAAVFGEIQAAREVAGLYLRSMGFQLQVRFIEGQS